MFIIIIVDNFRSQNKRLKEELKRKYAKKNLDAEKRHENNIKKVNEENEKLAKETEQKEFKKYISFYWLRKAQEKALREYMNQEANKK